MKRWLISCALAVTMLSAAALPSVEAVQAEISRGNYAQAQSMLQEVVQARPGSARAHYVYAEVLAHNGQLAQARQELKEARRLDPQTRFTSADKLAAFEQRLNHASAAGLGTGAAMGAATSTGAVVAAPSSHVAAPAAVSTEPAATADGRSRAGTGKASNTAEDASIGDWAAQLPMWLWGGAVAVMAWMFMRQRRPTPPTMAAPGGSPMTSNGFGINGMNRTNATNPTMMGPSAGMTGYPAGGAVPVNAGNSMLHTGVAMAGGIAAGMLAERLMHGGDNEPTHRDAWGLGGPAGSGAQAGTAAAGAAGGWVPGMFDDKAAGVADAGIDMGQGEGWGGEVGTPEGDGGGAGEGGSDGGGDGGGGW